MPLPTRTNLGSFISSLWTVWGKAWPTKVATWAKCKGFWLPLKTRNALSFILFGFISGQSFKPKKPSLFLWIFFEISKKDLRVSALRELKLLISFSFNGLPAFLSFSQMRLIVFSAENQDFLSIVQREKKSLVFPNLIKS